MWHSHEEDYTPSNINLTDFIRANLSLSIDLRLRLESFSVSNSQSNELPASRTVRTNCYLPQLR